MLTLWPRGWPEAGGIVGEIQATGVLVGVADAEPEDFGSEVLLDELCEGAAGAAAPEPEPAEPVAAEAGSAEPEPPAPSFGAPPDFSAAGEPSATLSEGECFGLSLSRKSVTYQPVPFNWKAGADNCLRNVGDPHAGQTESGASESFCRTSLVAPQLSHRYA